MNCTCASFHIWQETLTALLKSFGTRFRERVKIFNHCAVARCFPFVGSVYFLGCTSLLLTGW